MDDRDIFSLPTADEFSDQIERLLKVQELAGEDVQPLYFRTVESGLIKAECLMPNFGIFSFTRSRSGWGYSFFDCVVWPVDRGELQAAGARYLSLSRATGDLVWAPYEKSGKVTPNDIEHLTDFARESPRDVFERLFDFWFYDYPGLVPDAFTLENIEEIYAQA